MAGWPAKGGTWAISRRSAHRLVIARVSDVGEAQCRRQWLQRQNASRRAAKIFHNPLLTQDISRKVRRRSIE